MNIAASKMACVAIFMGGTLLAPKFLHAEELTMCQPHEEVYFSCPVKNKTVSVCASGNISPNNGYVQYRIGRPDKVELEYPKLPYPPASNFTISDIAGGNLNLIHLKFKSGLFNYIIYSGDVSGVYVKKNGKTIANLTCNDGVYQKLSPRALRGIKTVDPVDGVD